MKTKSYQPKRSVRRVIEALYEADREIERIRDHFDMEWGDNAHSDVDVQLSSAIRQMEAARKTLDGILDKFRGKSLRPNFPRKRQPAKSWGLKDLPLVF